MAPSNHERIEHQASAYFADELYSADHLPGDEDNGEMSAWYVFACLGTYPFCPGKAEYVRFTPFVRKASVRGPHLEGLLLFEKAAGVEAQPAGATLLPHDDLIQSASMESVLQEP